MPNKVVAGVADGVREGPPLAVGQREQLEVVFAREPRCPAPGRSGQQAAQCVGPGFLYLCLLKPLSHLKTKQVGRELGGRVLLKHNN